ncbi:hypothetical protein ACFC0K_36280 [Streptomyces hydrogenans]|uniref:hypothetical protein n=1 Tax=Streptomyces hydrogenans TaxID=1873719 RepID=UPI0035D5D790
MTTPTREREIETVSRQRKRRTRSRTLSTLPPLVISSLQPHEYDLDPACISLICPTCRTWVPIRVAQTERATAKLVPHHTEPAGTEDPVRCLGTYRLVVIDVTIARWSQLLEEGVAETNGRRSNRVTRKPKTAVAPAVMQIMAPLLDATVTRRAYEAHTQGCAACAPPKNTHCVDGERLAYLATHTKRHEPARTAILAQRDELTERFERSRWYERALGWTKTADDVRLSDIQRTDDVLAALLQSLTPKKADGPQLTDWESADLMSVIRLLATQLEQIRR